MGECGIHGLDRRTGEIHALGSLLNIEMGRTSHGKGGPKAKCKVVLCGVEW